ncbi:WGR domain-containing protein [Campylobacter upsaliensis]|uniref:WGR domain-containing protein n=1 Tax=Campylobacter upsaliensis TaxID=28080 RepID=UPI00214A163C|nr:WGR domain-containing protein [Campylobacter upsaliensis]MCR2113431.1 WGR domain-containing protein [Campylobacter upsaliensis]MCR2115546.1 WGR domain-containing protein [Campylobacter upsaliensis]MCR2120007.1 WGR domain-containing protein [Campylobacter upsaliensis]MCR2123908.1 WGR domain-containing protein [Campylobacter upsaliensis]
MNFVILHKTMPNHHIRYYSLELSATLFEEFVVKRIYGNTRYKSFTGQKVDIFTNYEEARDFFEMMKKKKIKKGYG